MAAGEGSRPQGDEDGLASVLPHRASQEGVAGHLLPRAASWIS